MPGIKNLNDIFNKKGEGFIKNLLNLKLTVTEKIAGSKFSFQYNDNKITFYKKDSLNPITKIDRTLMQFYEIAIEYIESLNDDIMQKLPNNFRFCFEYFPSKTPNFLTYNNLPKNNLILTHIIEREPKDDIMGIITSKKIIRDKKELNKWADILNVEGPPIIYEGKLSEFKKELLFDYLSMSKDEVKRKYKTESFTKILIGILNPKMKKTLLSDDLDSTIAGIIFTFENENSKYIAKLVDPVFDEIIKNQRDDDIKNDIIPMIFSDMIEFMEKEPKWKVLKLYKHDIEDRYIELMSKMFNTFIQQYGQQYENLNLYTPQFMKRPEFDLNKMFITNKKTLKNINISTTYRELFKIFIALFRKKKKKIKEFIAPSVLKYQNDIVDEIFKRISETNDIVDKNVDVDDLLTFEQLITYFSGNKDKPLQIDEGVSFDDLKFADETIDEANQLILESENIINESTNDLKTMKVLSFWQNAFDRPIKETKMISKAKAVNVYVGKFQPFNVADNQAVNEMYESNKRPVVLVQISKANNTFSSKLTEKCLKLIKQKNNKVIKEYITIRKDNLTAILKEVNKNFKVESIGSNNKSLGYFKSQMNHEINEDRLSEREIELFEFDKFTVDDKEVTQKDIIECLNNNNFIKFKKYVPKPLLGTYEEMRHEINKNK